MKHSFAILMLAGICLTGCAVPRATNRIARQPVMDEAPCSRGVSFGPPVYVIQFLNADSLWTNYAILNDAFDAMITGADAPLLSGKTIRILKTTNP